VDYVDYLRITTGVAVDPLIHAESYPPGSDTQCHSQSHVVHMHNWYVLAAQGTYPQYPQGLLTLLIPSFLFIQITSPLWPRSTQMTANAPRGPLFRDLLLADLRREPGIQKFGCARFSVAAEQVSDIARNLKKLVRFKLPGWSFLPACLQDTETWSSASWNRPIVTTDLRYPKRIHPTDLYAPRNFLTPDERWSCDLATLGWVDWHSVHDMG
jgi:hypothetical protein